MNPYAEFVKTHMPLILTAVDRDEDSMTYGCCDRNHWHLLIRDFSSAILQQTCLTLALAYKTDFKGNVFFGNENVKKWSIAALAYMKRIQLKDGSFNEYYPNEHGFPPTAFNLYAGCKTYELLELKDKTILDMLERAARWLCNHDEKRAFNQEAAALAGLTAYYGISGDNSIREAIDHKVDVLSSVYCDEGWFPEQGGADIGYSSVTLDMLMEYYEATKDSRLLKAINGLVAFLGHFVHPDGTIGGEYGSRNTIYFMPNGLETFISMGLDDSGIAAAMVDRVYRRKEMSDDFMLAVDERYLAHYVMHSFLRALSKYKDRKVSSDLPYDRVDGCFPKAGLYTFHIDDCFVVCGASKGGIIKVYKKDREIFWDCGYRIHISEKKKAATNWLDDKYDVNFKTGQITVSGNFNLVKQRVQTPFYHLALRLSSLFLGSRVNSLIKKLTIFQKKDFPSVFNRKITLTNDKIIIEDSIEGVGGRHLKEADNTSLRLVASGKFYSRSDIIRKDIDDYGNVDSLRRSREISITDGSVTTRIY